MSRRRWIPRALLTVLVFAASASAALGALKGTGSNEVQLLTKADLPGWRSIHNPEKNASITCSGHFFAKNSAHIPISQQVSFEGPGGADLIEVVVATDSPKVAYDATTRPFNICSSAPTAHIGPDLVVIRRLTYTASLSIYTVTENALISGTMTRIIQFLAFARLDHSVLSVLVATSERLRELGGEVAEALYKAEPALFPKLRIG
jgi:hypothetical protein